METLKVFRNFESKDEILSCDCSNRTFSAVLSHGTNYMSVFFKIKFAICFEF